MDGIIMVDNPNRWFIGKQEKICPGADPEEPRAVASFY
jgi:hypothetical protein